ncbi:MAG TPA: hypothetical protein VIL57_03340 [Bacteroidia bacterium]
MIKTLSFLVNYNEPAGAYAARITTDDGRKFLGYFKTESGAAIAYNIAAKTYHKEYAKLNEVKNGKKV